MRRSFSGFRLLALWLLPWIWDLNQVVAQEVTERNATATELKPDEAERVTGVAEKRATGEAVSDLEVLVEVRRGELPIILSAPHGGTLQIQGVPPRQGKGMKEGPSGFFIGRDGGTTELASELADAIEQRMGKRPYMVLSKVHRKYLDPNRPPEIAYEDPDATPVYQRYHGSLGTFSREILQKYRSGLLLDIHGQGTSKSTVYRGTGNGKTVTRLRERFGEQSHSGEESFFGMLHELGWQVHPYPADGKEQSGFTGGYIVQTHGSHRPEGVDAIQLEFGADYRDKANRKKIARELAEAVEDYLTEYVLIESSSKRGSSK
jgi:N-formylglutamate amidohydrolase